MEKKKVEVSARMGSFTIGGHDVRFVFTSETDIWISVADMLCLLTNDPKSGRLSPGTVDNAMRQYPDTAAECLAKFPLPKKDGNPTRTMHWTYHIKTPLSILCINEENEAEIVRAIHQPLLKELSGQELST